MPLAGSIAESGEEFAIRGGICVALSVTPVQSTSVAILKDCEKDHQLFF